MVIHMGDHTERQHTPPPPTLAHHQLRPLTFPHPPTPTPSPPPPHLKPRLLFRPWRMLSPSSSAVRCPRAWSRCSRWVATVDLPLAERPVCGGGGGERRGEEGVGG